ncbi:maleylpyruvate isomerase N-terminal domain-containing protein [Streptomyces toxytricini]|uniref:maleylpyruvate isomerase N-terminal domain-containing protein n=1 Tax=Streptomyces toxytricini TaxID=67369 RepID=UPI0034485276
MTDSLDHSALLQLIDERSAAIVAAGPAEAPPAKEAAEAPRELDALLAWYDDSHELLLRTLREAGPERECWTWWSAGVPPANARGVARRRVHEVLVPTTPNSPQAP